MLGLVRAFPFARAIQMDLLGGSGSGSDGDDDPVPGLAPAAAPAPAPAPLPRVPASAPPVVVGTTADGRRVVRLALPLPRELPPGDDDEASVDYDWGAGPLKLCGREEEEGGGCERRGALQDGGCRSSCRRYR